jgi:endonuclease YncB( thermonuclease family)
MVRERFKYLASTIIACILTAGAALLSLASCDPAFASEPSIVTDERAKMLKRVEPYVSKSGFTRIPKTITGPVYGTVIGVQDGDSVIVDAYPWPGIIARTNLRIFGADTPEKRRHLAACDKEVELGKNATAFVKERIKPGDTIIIRTAFFGKYAGRVVAELDYRDDEGWQSLLGALIDADLADPYFGDTKPKSWCD